MKKFVSSGPKESRKFAQNFAKEILAEKSAENGAPLSPETGLVIALVGELGSGKTTFAQNFAKALGVREKIKSPTFVITKKYQIPNTKFQTNHKSQKSKTQTKTKYLYHFDAYRIHDEKEILNLGWEEIINNPQNIVLVEWADKIKKILPKDCVKIKFKHLIENKRGITIS